MTRTSGARKFGLSSTIAALVAPKHITAKGVPRQGGESSRGFEVPERGSIPCSWTAFRPMAACLTLLVALSRGWELARGRWSAVAPDCQPEDWDRKRLALSSKQKDRPRGGRDLRRTGLRWPLYEVPKARRREVTFCPDDGRSAQIRWRSTTGFAGPIPRSPRRTLGKLGCCGQQVVAGYEWEAA